MLFCKVNNIHNHPLQAQNQCKKITPIKPMQQNKYKTKTQNKMFSHILEQNPLVFTSFLFFGTCLFCLFHTRYRVLSPMEEFLFVSLLIQTLLSVAFWVNPFPPFSLRHKIDAIFVKINGITFSTYILFLKSLSPWHRVSFLSCLLLTLSCFYQSDKYSRQIWCCEKHIFWHGWSHLFTAMGISHAFL